MIYNTDSFSQNKILALIILDGWGISSDPDTSHNAIKLANTKTFDKLIASYPNIEINASGEYVGLPDGLIQVILLRLRISEHPI